MKGPISILFTLILVLKSLIYIFQLIYMDKWEKLGYIAAIFNPVPTSLLTG
jgi:hypothetical protein